MTCSSSTFSPVLLEAEDDVLLLLLHLLREKKLAWLRNLYSRGAAEAACDVIDEDGDSDIVDSGDDLESGEDLVAWSESLNFDAYRKDWLGLGTCGWGELVES